MKERPILFSAPMVQAIIDGCKTKTRRLVKPQPNNTSIPFEFVSGWGWCQRIKISSNSDRYEIVNLVKCPYGGVGDRLWVREAHRLLNCNCDTCQVPETVFYEADGSGYQGAIQGRLRPSIHMPRWASRINLEIVNIRIERLQDITMEGVKSEGLRSRYDDSQWEVIGGRHEGDWRCGGHGHTNESVAKSAFAHLWTSINGKESWESNPYVWVVEFKRVES